MSYTKGELKTLDGNQIACCIDVDAGSAAILCLADTLENAEANARRICQCVNNFDKLLEACKKSYQAIAIASKYVRLSGSQPQRAEAQELVEIGDAIDAAIAAAEKAEVK